MQVLNVKKYPLQIFLAVKETVPATFSLNADTRAEHRQRPFQRVGRLLPCQDFPHVCARCLVVGASPALFPTRRNPLLEAPLSVFAVVDPSSHRLPRASTSLVECRAFISSLVADSTGFKGKNNGACARVSATVDLAIANSCRN